RDRRSLRRANTPTLRGLQPGRWNDTDKTSEVRSRSARRAHRGRPRVLQAALHWPAGTRADARERVGSESPGAENGSGLQARRDRACRRVPSVAAHLGKPLGDGWHAAGRSRHEPRAHRHTNGREALWASRAKLCRRRHSQACTALRQGALQCEGAVMADDDPYNVLVRELTEISNRLDSAPVDAPVKALDVVSAFYGFLSDLGAPEEARWPVSHAINVLIDAVCAADHGNAPGPKPIHIQEIETLGVAAAAVTALRACGWSVDNAVKTVS